MNEPTSDMPSIFISTTPFRKVAVINMHMKKISYWAAIPVKPIVRRFVTHSSFVDYTFPQITLYTGQPGQYTVSISTSTDNADIRDASTNSLKDFILMERHSHPKYSYFQIAFRTVSIVFTVGFFGFYLFKYFQTPYRTTVEQKVFFQLFSYRSMIHFPLFFCRWL